MEFIVHNLVTIQKKQVSIYNNEPKVTNGAEVWLTYKFVPSTVCNSQFCASANRKQKWMVLHANSTRSVSMYMWPYNVDTPSETLS